MSASFSVCPKAVGQHRPSSPPPHVNSNPPHLPPLPPLLLSPPHVSASSFLAHYNSGSGSGPANTKLAEPREPFLHRPRAHAFYDNASRSYTAGPGNAYEYSHTKLPQIVNPGTSNGGFPITLPPPSLPLPSIAPTGPTVSSVPSPQAHPPTPQRHILPLPPPRTHGASIQQRKLSSTQSGPSRRPSGSSSSTEDSPAMGRTSLPIGRKDSNTETNLYRSSISHSRHSSQASVYFTPVTAAIAADRRTSFDMDSKPVSPPKLADTSVSSTPTSLGLKPAAICPFPQPIQARNMPTITPPVATPTKSRRVRTGCLTCRERHLKCDEGVPDCVNCRKGARECKRGLRLNFIDIQVKPIPFVPAVTCWKVTFFDESRIIADEYAGGLARYPRAPNVPRPNTSTYITASHPQQLPEHASKPTSGGMYISKDAPFGQQPLMPLPQTVMPSLSSIQHPYLAPQHTQYPQRNDTQADSDKGIGGNARDLHGFHGNSYERKEHHCDSPGSDSSIASSMVPQGLGGPSSVASFEADVGNSPTSVDAECEPGNGGNTYGLQNQLPEGLPTPPSEKMGLLRGNGVGLNLGVTGRLEDAPNSKCGSNGGEREYLHSPDEVSHMQTFVDDVGVWMDSLDKDKHFSRIIPYMALKSPMMLSAFLACGVKHKALVKDASCDRLALQYYDTSTTQLLRSLQNPDRDIVESAVTAVILSVYETMNEKWADRKVHTIGTWVLVRDCGWNAESKGIGAACFWLSIRTEVLSCLEFNWPTAWDPDQWGLDWEFINPVSDIWEANTCHDSGSKHIATKPKPFATVSDVVSAITGGEEEEAWVHRILYIVAKVANFRASVPRFQEPSPHDEQVRHQNRFSEWKRLKSLCDKWNDECPQSMRPFSYFLPMEDSMNSNKSRSLFPNIWLIKQTAIMGRLLYHTAMVLLHQLNPVEPFDSRVNLNAQRHHAHQVCGIVAHTNDPGVASVAIRSLAISALVLSDIREQNEAYALLRNISKTSGWRTDHVCSELQNVWGRDLEETETDAPTASMTPMSNSFLPPPSDLTATGVLPGNFGFDLPNWSPNIASGTSFPMSIQSMQSHRGPLSLTSLSPSGNRLRLSDPCSSGPSDGRPSHLQMQSTASIIANASFIGATTVGSSPPQPLSMAAMTYRLPMANPLTQADFNLPDHPYKAFYKPPNNSAQFSNKSEVSVK